MKNRIVALILSASLVSAACGGNDGPAAGSKFNDQDAAFAQEMIPHHRQAVEMAKLADTRANSRDVKTLARAIEDAQDPEIAKMEGWLEDWNKPVPDESMSGMNHGSQDPMEGMMSDADRDSLVDASGTEFDTMFLTMMVKHHQGAITMAGSEMANGKNPEALALAKTIRGAQTGEIARMGDLLKQ
jgi:uncharacterized protein (DUF305 family)